MEVDNKVAGLYYRSKSTSLIILAITAMLCSRSLFFFFTDAEGPNLLIVIVLALVIYLISCAMYVFGPVKIAGIKRLLAAIVLQIILVVILYFCMR